MGALKVQRQVAVQEAEAVSPEGALQGLTGHGRVPGGPQQAAGREVPGSPPFHRRAALAHQAGPRASVVVEWPQVTWGPGL